MIQLGGFLNRLIGASLKTGLLLIENLLKPLDKSVLVPLGLTAAALATDAAIQKKIFGWVTTTLVFPNKDLNDIMKIAKYLKEPCLLIKDVSETVENEVKNKKRVFGYVGCYIGCSFISKCVGR